jgi:hypothetical protein
MCKSKYKGRVNDFFEKSRKWEKSGGKCIFFEKTNIVEENVRILNLQELFKTER